MSYAYDSNEDFADDLEQFAKNCEDSKIGFRMFCGRLYYAMFHKVVSHNENLKGKRPKHRHIANGMVDKECKNAYGFLLDLREWADYNIETKSVNKERLLKCYKSVLSRDLTCIIK